MIAYTGGRTAGHVMPLIGIINESNEDSVYVGFVNDIEENICANNRIKFIGIKKYPNKIKSVLLGYFYLKRQLRNYKIRCVVSSGGYNSLILCMYAIFKRIPLYLLEENVVLGRLNQLMYPFCKKIFLAYDLKLKKGIYTGLPVRKKEYINYVNKYDVLIIGGSLGSKVLCDAAIMLRDKYRVLLIAGNYYEEYKDYEGINVIEFSDDIYKLMKQSKVIIARGGASTAYEIFYINKPFICIPSLKTKRNHQYLNAEYLKNRNALLLVLEGRINEELIDYIELLINNNQFRYNMLISQRKIFKDNSSKEIINILKRVDK